MSILLKVIYKSNMNPVKTPMAVFTEIEKKSLKICMTLQRLWDPKIILRKQNKARAITLLNWNYVTKEKRKDIPIWMQNPKE